MKDWKKTVISQYANSPSLLYLLNSINEWIDPSADINLFYRRIWDLKTADGIGLDIWGRIVGIGRVLSVPIASDAFGFNTDGLDFQPFGQAPFYVPGQEYENLSLGDEDYRRLIFIKAAANIAACDVKSLNTILKGLFPDRGRCYVNDYGRMHIRYNFEFELTAVEIAILNIEGIFPRPAGVGFSFSQIPVGIFFGFSEMGIGDITPFNEGSFYAGLGVDSAVPPSRFAPLGVFRLTYHELQGAS